MPTYKSLREPKTYVVSDGEVDPKYKTVNLIYSNGQTRSVTSATFHMYFKKVSDEDSFSIAE